MKVLMVLDHEFPPDERVEKEISSLKETGYELSIAVYTFLDQPAIQIYNGYTIYRKKISEFIYKSSAAALVFPMYFRFWYRFLDGILQREKFDVLHIHDLPLSKTGYLLSLKHDLKLVCDQHEFYSNWIVRTKHYNTLSGKIIRFFSNWKKYERIYLQKSDLVITVGDALKKIYIDKVFIHPDKIVTLPNTPSDKIFNLNNVENEIVKKYSDNFVLFYGGSIDHLRGLDFIARCVAKLKGEIGNILFVIAGKENKAFNIGQMIKDFNIEENTDFVNWIPLNILPSYIAASNICVFVPRADNLEINNTIVTKIYQYASMGKPIIVSEARMMKAFVEQNNIGFSVNYGDVEGFSKIVRNLFQNKAISEEISSKAKGIAKNYTWENTSRDFINAYVKMSK